MIYHYKLMPICHYFSLKTFVMIVHEQKSIYMTFFNDISEDNNR